MALISVGKVGFLLSALGAAHFAAPEKFEEVTRAAFPENTRFLFNDTATTEMTIGAAMMVKRTRKLGVAALLGYSGWLGYSAVNAKS